MLLLSLSLTGCAPESADSLQDGSSELRYDEGSPEALGLQAFLNDADTTLALLDDTVGLNAIAASNLIAHRDGPDATFGTGDDDLFETVQEIDDVYYVGPSALSLLFDYAIDSGWVSDDQPVLIEGVEFTAEQAELTLALANVASLALLDDDVALDSRAATNIVADRPLADIEALAAVSYVGKSALTKLRDYADSNPLPEEEVDEGAGEWEDCDTTADCADGLVCLGEHLSDGWFCVSEDLAGTFESGDLSESIPDDDPDGLTSTVSVTGMATVSVDLVVTLDIDHPRPADLTVTLYNPYGTEGEVVSGSYSVSGDHIVRAIPSDEVANGDWSITVVDAASGQAGTLTSWSLYMISTYD